MQQDFVHREDLLRNLNVYLIRAESALLPLCYIFVTQFEKLQCTLVQSGSMLLSYVQQYTRGARLLFILEGLQRFHTFLLHCCIVSDLHPIHTILSIDCIVPVIPCTLFYTTCCLLCNNYTNGAILVILECLY